MHRLAFMHRASTQGAATARAGGTAKGRRIRRIDDVDDDAARLEPVRIDRHWIVGVHAERRGIDNDLVSAWIGCARTCFAAGGGGDGLGEVLGATLVDIGYGKCPGTRGRERK